jgi:hypothetical protein
MHRMAPDVDRMRAVLLAVLDVLERGLARIDRAHDRVAMRRFLKQHPEVIPHWTDGTD